MNLLNKLTIKSLKLNKKRTIVTIIGIILSVALLSAVSSLYSSAIKSLIRYETSVKGNYHFAFYDVPVNNIEDFRNNRKLDDLFFTKHFGMAKINSENKRKPYVHLMGFTEDSLNNLSVTLVDGRFPENDNEILIPTHLKTNGRVFLSVGSEITLDLGYRVSEGEVLTYKEAFDPERKEDINIEYSKTYKIVGVIERPDRSIEGYTNPGYTLITLLDDKDLNGTVDIYSRLTKDGLKDSYRVATSILGIDETLYQKMKNGEILNKEDFDKLQYQIDNAKYEFNENSYLIALETNPFTHDNAASGLGIVVLIVCFIIVVTSVYCIKNSFDISITEKTKQYGMLRSVGATKKQIRKNVFYEAFILGIIGIPLGVLSGLFASFILVIVTNYFLNGLFPRTLYLEFNLSVIAIIFSIILGILTIYLSALRSARKASKITPIDSIRNSANIKINYKKIKTSKIISKIFGIGGEISLKNIKRNKKKYRTTTISIIVSVSVFIALSSFINLAFLTLHNDFKNKDYNVQLLMNTENEGAYQRGLETVNFETVEEYTIYNHGAIQAQNTKFSKDFENYYGKSFDVQARENESFINIMAVGDASYQKFIKSLGLDYDDVKDKGILIDKESITMADPKSGKLKYKKMRKYAYKKGDTIDFIDIKEHEETISSIEVAMVTDKKPFALNDYDFAMLVVSDEWYEANYSNDKSRLTIYYKATDADKLQNDIDGLLKSYDYNISNISESVRQMQSFFTLVAIFLYGFIIVITLIGITNIFNTITTSMHLRRQEFAMLKSIGMTNNEFTKMIRLESIFIGLKSLIFGIPIGIALSYLIYHFLANERAMEYPIPFVPVIIAIIAVYLLITIIMHYSMNKISKQNTIETIRNENI